MVSTVTPELAVAAEVYRRLKALGIHCYVDEATALVLPLAAPEDVVAKKLAWFRAGGEQSDQRWRDVVGVLKAQRDRLDLVRIRGLGAQLAVSDLLERALVAGGVVPADLFDP